MDWIPQPHVMRIILHFKTSRSVVPKLRYEPGHLRVREKKLNNGGKRHIRQQCKTRHKSKFVKLIEIH
jgi:hypothetical protein